MSLMAGCKPYRSEIVNRTGEPLTWSAEIRGSPQMKESKLLNGGNALMFAKIGAYTSITYEQSGVFICRLDAAAIMRLARQNTFGRMSIALPLCQP